MIYAKNKKALYDYKVLEKMEVGISLKSTEVKSVIKSAINLKGSYVYIENNRVKLINASISKPDRISTFSIHDENRDKYLLLHKSEINKLRKKVEQKGLSLVVLDIYKGKSSKIKCTLALVQGKKSYDKKTAIKERTLDIESKRELKNY